VRTDRRIISATARASYKINLQNKKASSRERRLLDAGFAEREVNALSPSQISSAFDNGGFSAAHRANQDFI